MKIRVYNKVEFYSNKKKSMTIKLKSVGIIAVIALAVFVLASMFFRYESAQASASSGLPATQRVATTTSVGPDEVKRLYNKQPSCASRIVRTQGTEIYLIFADPVGGNLASTSLSAVAGFVQLASTTVAYDSGIYGCGELWGEAISSTTITTAEMW